MREGGQGEAAVFDWIAQWIISGFKAVEQLIGDTDWCFGPGLSLADIYLVPQVFSARRFRVGLDAFPRIKRVAALAGEHPTFQRAAPANQPDAE